MISKNDIGKKVWVLNGNIRDGFTLNSKKEWTIKDVNYPGVVVERNGKEFFTNAYAIVFPLIDNDIMAYLEANDVDNVLNVEKICIGGIRVNIEWGDWKHTHLWCDELMSYIGYKFMNEIETETNGSDCYSADRYYEIEHIK